MNLHLIRPAIFFDLEATSADKQNAAIIQFCFLKTFPDGSTTQLAALVNPGPVEISQSSIEVHGITPEKVKDCKPFYAHAGEVLDFISGCDLVGFGCLMFDVPLLFNELNRAGYVWDYTKHHIVDACNIFKRQVPRDLSAAHLHYCDGPFENAHDALADVEATKRVFINQLIRHQLNADMHALALYSNYDKPLVDLSGKFVVDSDGDIVINFSQNKGQKAKDNHSFLYWMLEREFSEDVKIICRKVLDESVPVNSAFKDDLPF